MIIVQEIKTNEQTKKAVISAFADTKDEVASGTFVGLPEGYGIDFGSSVLTANGEIAFMKSDGTWNWLGEEE